MILIEECREVLGEQAVGMSDERVAELRDTLYFIVESILDDYLDQKNPIPAESSSNPEF